MRSLKVKESDLFEQWLSHEVVDWRDWSSDHHSIIVQTYWLSNGKFIFSYLCFIIIIFCWFKYTEEGSCRNLPLIYFFLTKDTFLQDIEIQLIYQNRIIYHCYIVMKINESESWSVLDDVSNKRWVKNSTEISSRSSVAQTLLKFLSLIQHAWMNENDSLFIRHLMVVI